MNWRNIPTFSQFYRIFWRNVMQVTGTVWNYSWAMQMRAWRSVSICRQGDEFPSCCWWWWRHHRCAHLKDLVEFTWNDFLKKFQFIFFPKQTTSFKRNSEKKEIQPKCWWSVTFVLGDKVSQSGIWKLIGQGEMFECMRFLCWTFYANHRMACNGPHESVASTFSPCLIYDHVDSARSLNYLHLFLSRNKILIELKFISFIGLWINST